MHIIYFIQALKGAETFTETLPDTSGKALIIWALRGLPSDGLLVVLTTKTTKNKKKNRYSTTQTNHG